MKKIILISMLIAISCFARIGETQAECIKRYGKPINMDKSKIAFSKNGFYIGTMFINGKCEAIAYYKMEKDALDRAIEITENEAMILMKSNSNKKWIQGSKSFSEILWSSEDSNLSALLSTYPKRSLIIMSKKYLAHTRKETNDKENNNLKGF